MSTAKSKRHGRRTSVATAPPVRTVLIVEPEALLRWSLVTYLGRWFQVFAADSVSAADRLLDEQPIDAAVLSDDLPDGGADQIERHLRIRNPTPCVVRTSTRPATGSGTSQTTARLEKPFDLTALANLLKTKDSPAPR